MNTGTPRKVLYILRTRGHGKILPTVQIRDERFTLIAYFRLNNPDRALRIAGLDTWKEQLLEILPQLPEGKVIRVELDPATGKIRVQNGKTTSPFT